MLYEESDKVVETISHFNFHHAWVPKDCMNSTYKNMEAQGNN